MLSIPDMALLGAAALLLFGPDQLPRVARKAGAVMRDIQNTSQAFVREMERAADSHETVTPPPPAATSDLAYTPPPPIVDPYDEPVVARAPHGVDPYDDPPVAEKLGEPRPALDQIPSAPAEPTPQGEHPTHV
jgi:sec-independent protein translocase protein TatA